MSFIRECITVLSSFFESAKTTDTLSPDLSFGGQNVLITGATSGLGFETAIHYVHFGANVIITTRNATKGEQAKLEIQKRTSKLVQVIILNIDTFDGVKNFMRTLKSDVKSLDIVLLNAGVHDFEWRTSPEGWFTNTQVNVLSTILLGLLFLQWMREKPGQSHLGFTGSSSHYSVDLSKWPKQDILQFWNQKENFISGRDNYGISKLMLHYCIQEMAILAAADGKPKPMVNSVCPGMVRSDIARDYAKKGFLQKWLVKIFFYVKANPTDIGASSGWDNHTRRPWNLQTSTFDGRGVCKYFKTAEGKKFQAEVWKEVVEVLAAVEPAVSSIVRM